MNSSHRVLFLLFSLIPNYGSAGIEQYYGYTNRAELNVTQKNYVKALQLYDSAFNSIDKNRLFVYDLYNAALCAAKVSRNEKLKAYAILLGDNGFPISFFKRSTFENIIRDKNFCKKLKISCQKFSQNQDITLNKSFNLIVYKYDSLMNYCEKNSDFNNPFRIALSKTVEEFINAYGFPCDNK